MRICEICRIGISLLFGQNDKQWPFLSEPGMDGTETGWFERNARITETKRKKVNETLGNADSQMMIELQFV